MVGKYTDAYPVCNPDPSRVLEIDDLTFIHLDCFPISVGHTLVIPKRHIATLFGCIDEEQKALLKVVNRAKQLLDMLYEPDGYNIGINHGPAAGQTVSHLHIHVIPRYLGDQADPRGGIRWIFPEKTNYWS